MKLSWVVSYALIVGICLLHQLPTDGSPFSLLMTVEHQPSGRRFLKEQSYPETKPVEDGKPEVVGVKERIGTKQERKVQHEKDEEEGLIYYVDYQGVMTHPSPLPTHPKP